MTGGLRRRWPTLLVVVLAAAYVWIGVIAQGWDRLWGVGGGLVIVSALVAATRSWAPALVLLVLGCLPLAVATWWSIVSPVLAFLVLAIGARVVRASHASRPRVAA